MTEDGKYSLKYSWDNEWRDGGYGKEDSDNRKFGLCDALFWISIIRPPDGSLSTAVYSVDGDTKEFDNLPSKELQFIMFYLAAGLKDDKEIEPEVRRMMDKFVNEMRSYFKVRNKFFKEMERRGDENGRK